MGLYNYGHKVAEEKKVARAQGYDYDASYKDLVNACAAIRGKPLAEAKKTLEEAAAAKKAIPYKKFSKGTGHRSELGGSKGRYPKKEARILLGLLKNAAANAAFKGMDAAKLFVRSAIAYKQNVFPRYRKFWPGGSILGYGKQATWANYATARAEVTLEEREPKQKKEKRAKQ
ncbi:MAG: 50S ribosomal protein L22 [Candidatus Micrarchaeota archaeon]